MRLVPYFCTQRIAQVLASLRFFDKVNNLRKRVGSSVKVIAQIRFVFLQFHNLVFHTTAHNQLVDLHALLLTDTVRAVGCLIHNRVVPPRIVMHHDIRAGQINSRSARFERDEKNACFIGIKGVYQFNSFVFWSVAL